MSTRENELREILAKKSGCERMFIGNVFCPTMEAELEYAVYTYSQSKKLGFEVTTIDGIPSEIYLPQPQSLFFRTDKKSIVTALQTINARVEYSVICMVPILMDAKGIRKYIFQPIYFAEQTGVIARTYPHLSFEIPKQDLIVIKRIEEKYGALINYLARNRVSLLLAIDDSGNIYLCNAFFQGQRLTSNNVFITREIPINLDGDLCLNIRHAALKYELATKLSISEIRDSFDYVDLAGKIFSFLEKEAPLEVKVIRRNEINSFLLISEKDEKDLCLTRFKNNDSIIC